MLTGLDHLVILVNDLDQAVADYSALGFRVSPGGTHADGLTHNALVVFSDSTYLELIAFRDPSDTRDNVWGWRQFASKGGGLIDYCVASDDLEADIAALRARGLNINGPSDGGRQRPDGAELHWRSGHFWQAGRELPFLIEDVTPRDLRVPDGSAAQHLNGVTGIDRLVVAVADLERQADHWSAITGSDSTYADDHRRDARTATFELGSQRIVLAESRMELGMIQQHIEAHGLGPFEAVLRGSSASFDPRLTHGARLQTR